MLLKQNLKKAKKVQKEAEEHFPQMNSLQEERGSYTLQCFPLALVAFAFKLTCP